MTTEPRGSTLRSASEAPSITESPTASTFGARFAADAVRSSGRSATPRASGVEVTDTPRAPRTRSRGGDVNWRALVALAAGLVAGWAWQFGLTPEFQGPLAKALSNTDLSWLTGGLVAGGLYWALVAREPEPVRVEEIVIDDQRELSPTA